MAKILQVSKSAYYASLYRKPSIRALENQALLDKIKQVHVKSRCIYGSPKIHAELKRVGTPCSRPRVNPHSDKGCQYTSDDFKHLMHEKKVKLSMSGTGHCYDNAVA